MNSIDALFQRLRATGRKAFIPFLTAGDPTPAATVQLARAVAAHGAALLELGFPYSDPIADGPVIQASYTRVLDRGLKLDDVFHCAREISRAPELTGGKVPLTAMVSYSIIHRRGADKFLTQAIDAGFSGAIVPDLPADESDELTRLAAGRDFKIIQLVTPTTPRDRAVEIVRRSSGFLYCVSIAGITGERAQVPEELLDQLTWLRRQTTLPLCVGFGISKPEHVRMLRDHVDGIIVGSAIVRLVEQAGEHPLEDVIAAVSGLVKTFNTSLSPS
jgi:tryptophan synthase alpha chain